MIDSGYMRMALDLAAKWTGFVSPNPLVGALVVKEGRIVGCGWHKAVGGPHAEVHALDEAGEQARGATLYVTLEPCNHYGRTPPCTKRILEAGVRRVVVAMEDPNPNVTGGGIDFLRGNGLEVTCGVCEREALRLNEAFIKFVRTGRPFVVLKMAATLDGRIATRTGDARWVTGKAARAHVHYLRHSMDAILVGAGTVQVDDPQLTVRFEEGHVPFNGRPADPTRFVLDTHLRMSPSARMLQQSSAADTFIVCAARPKAANKERLIAAGARILRVPLQQGRVDLNALMIQMGIMGISSLLIEGGARVADAALKADIVDKIIFFYAPKIMGGDDGVPMLRGLGPEQMSGCLGIRQMQVDMLGQDIMIQGYRHFED
jgi:diaminohydroxyphosphoribosylaminopyrimidine deaminase/5-amino-6-(5-phosphoribosylamino)uracil reductase